MKIWVLGATGMLGQSLALALENHGHEVEMTGRDRADLTDMISLEKAFIEIKPDFVINATAYTNVDKAEEEKELAFLINEVGVQNLANVLEKYETPLVHFSTDYIFKGDNAAGYAEDSVEFGPQNVYGQSKLAGEMAIINTMKKYFIIRTSWLYGINGNNFVETMLRLAEEKDELAVVNDQIGRPTSVDDLSLMVLSLLETYADWGIYHGVNEVSGEVPGVSWYDFAAKIFELSGKTIKLNTMTTEQLNRPATRPAYSILLNQKFAALPTWERSLADYLNKYHS